MAHKLGSKIRTPDLENECITSSELASNAVNTIHLTDSVVTNPKLADLSISTEKLQDDSVTNDKLASSSVDTLQLSDYSVTTEKLALLSIDTPQLSDYSVTQPKIANGAVGLTQLEDYSINSNKILDGSIIEGKLANSSVSTDKIQNAAVDVSKLAPDVISLFPLPMSSKKVLENIKVFSTIVSPGITNVDVTEIIGSGSVATPSFSIIEGVINDSPYNSVPIRWSLDGGYIIDPTAERRVYGRLTSSVDTPGISNFWYLNFFTTLDFTGGEVEASIPNGITTIDWQYKIRNNLSSVSENFAVDPFEIEDTRPVAMESLMLKQLTSDPTDLIAGKPKIWFNSTTNQLFLWTGTETEPRVIG